MQASEIGEQMNIQRLNSILTHKETDLTDLRDDLAELVSNHPYSGPFRMLLAKASKDAGHLDQKQDLLAAAAHCNSRKALFELMFGELMFYHLFHDVCVQPFYHQTERCIFSTKSNLQT